MAAQVFLSGVLPAMLLVSWAASATNGFERLLRTLPCLAQVGSFVLVLTYFRQSKLPLCSSQQPALLIRTLVVCNFLQSTFFCISLATPSLGADKAISRPAMGALFGLQQLFWVIINFTYVSIISESWPNGRRVVRWLCAILLPALLTFYNLIAVGISPRFVIACVWMPGALFYAIALFRRYHKPLDQTPFERHALAALEPLAWIMVMLLTCGSLVFLALDSIPSQRTRGQTLLLVVTIAQVRPLMCWCGICLEGARADVALRSQVLIIDLGMQMVCIRWGDGIVDKARPSSQDQAEMHNMTASGQRPRVSARARQNCTCGRYQAGI
jgi:hypothetical protein